MKNTKNTLKQKVLEECGIAKNAMAEIKSVIIGWRDYISQGRRGRFIPRRESPIPVRITSQKNYQAQEQNNYSCWR